MSNPATVDCYDTGTQYVFWCRYCRRWHFHGRENGHRVAHCHRPESPYRFDGYILHCIGTATPAVLHAVAWRRPKGGTP